MIKNVRQMTDLELASWLKDLIENHEPESLHLDYKEAINIHNDSSKKELAKDISSFANEQGGILIYGVPEEKIGELPRPKPLNECGMNVDAGLPERVENILIATVQPPLHALTIQVVDIGESAPKKLLVIHHPESYWKPHMVEGYKDRRFYRRCNFRAVEMNEREVEAAYLAREATRTHARTFLDNALFGSTHGFQIRAIACPVAPGRYKDQMLHPSFRQWLDSNHPMGATLARSGEWIPFLDGWRFVPVPKGSVAGKQYEIRVFHNGAVCLNLDPSSSLESGTLLLDQLQDDIFNLFIRYASTVFDGLGVKSPVVVRLSLFRAKGLKATPRAKEYHKIRYIREQIAQQSSAATENGIYHAAPDEPSGQPYMDGQDIAFDEETSTDEITDQPEHLMSRLMARIATAFGLRGDEENEV